MSNLNSEAITVITDHLAPTAYRDGLTVARFQWTEFQPRDPYSFDLSQHVSLRLDGHIPVKPVELNVYDEGLPESVELLTPLFGGAFTEALLRTRRVGITSVNFSLRSDHRFAIAELQAQSPSTPALLRSAAAAMGREHASAESGPLIPAQPQEVRHDITAGWPLRRFAA